MSGTGPNNDVLNWGRTGRLLAKLAALADGLPSIMRASPYGDAITSILTGKQHQLADEGTYFVCRTPTIATGIAGVTSLTGYTATSPVLIVTNNNPQGGKNIWMDYWSLTCTATAASTTSLFLATVLDSVSRYSSAGSGGAGTNLATALIGPYATNVASPVASNALVYAGALVATAASPQARILSNRLVRQQIPVVLDQYIVNFGTDAVGGPLPPQALSAAVPSVSTVAHAPVCIPPGGSFLGYYYGAAMGAAPSFEVEVGFVER
jgi:hypothetical protein